MEISKWDLYRQIDKIPVEKYKKIKDYLDRLTDQNSDEVLLDEKSKKNFENALEEYSNDEYLSFNEVFEDDEKK